MLTEKIHRSSVSLIPAACGEQTGFRAVPRLHRGDYGRCPSGTPAEKADPPAGPERRPPRWVGPGEGSPARPGRAEPKGLAPLHGGKSRRATALYFLSSEPRPSLPLPCAGKRVSLAGRLAGMSQGGKG